MRIALLLCDGRRSLVIPITPLAGSTILMNVRFIEQIEEGTTTVVVLAGGQRMVVADVARDLVDRIQRIHAKVAAEGSGQLRVPRNREARTTGPLPSRERQVATVGPASLEAPEERASNAGGLHSGQIAFDRALAGIARDQETCSPANANLPRLDLLAARDDLLRLVVSIENPTESATANQLVTILTDCTDRLTDIAEGESRRLRRAHRRQLKDISRTLTALRAAWSQIAADASQPDCESVHPLVDGLVRRRQLRAI